MAQEIAWGNATLFFEHERFQQGYQYGRRYYFEDEQEALDFKSQSHFSTQRILHLIAHRDEQGYYQLDDGLDISAFRQGVEELLGVLVGYMSGPLHPEAAEEYRERIAEYIPLPEHAAI